MVSLKPVTEDNFSECINLGVHEAQRGFVADNVFSLAQAWLYHAAARPFAIYDGDVMVGFVMLYVDEKEKDCGIWRFMIDKRHQRKGYGKAAMKVILDYIVKEGPSFTGVRLSYEPENTVAEKLYRSFGFLPTGEVDGDEIVMALKLADAGG